MLASDRIQIVVIFALGFLLSRLFLKTGAAERLVMGLMRRAGDQPGNISFFLIFSSSLLSSFIPNAIVVLTLLPALKMLIDQLAPPQGDRRQRRLATTYLTCSLIWGANIGGNGSIIGSPANLLLLFFLGQFNVEGGDRIGFFSWLLWGIPLVLVLDLAAWLIGRLFFKGLHPPEEPQLYRTGRLSPPIRATIWMSAAFLAASASVSALSFVFRDSAQVLVGLNLATLAGASLFVIALFRPNPLTRWLGSGSRLMKPADCWSDLPWRGLLFAGALFGVFGLVAIWADRVGFDNAVGEWAARSIPDNTSPLVVLLVLCTATIYLTEFLSNSLVAAVFFVAAGSVGPAIDMAVAPLFVGIGMASTCAFMTPVATPVNSLAFGEIRGLSLPRMLAAGFVLNMISVAFITLVAGWIVPWVLGIE